mmetsp:Transcript_42868/g.56686  ORF Transcript_42868/g.56686 Transcript_42868/m.56686 type:complete len:92 (+) Transcript_42868:87-362(+)
MFLAPPWPIFSFAGSNRIASDNSVDCFDDFLHSLRFDSKFGLIGLIGAHLAHIIFIEELVGTGATLGSPVALLADFAHLARVDRLLGVFIN